MVEVDIQFLGGVAMTVFLALVFFGVVVLWDVALAIRSVGDKIDKLEDNLDDDLTDIGHSLDGMSGARGSGAQVHLSGGGTISPGPSPQAPQHGNDGPNAADQQARSTARSERGSDTRSERGPDRSGVRVDRGMESEDRAPGPYPRHPGQPGTVSNSRAARPESRGVESDLGSVPSDESPPAAGSAADGEDGEEAGEVASDSDVESDGEVAGDDAEESSGDEQAADEPTDESTTDEHPRAAVNRGRFVTSPDRTPWYATPLDREAIAAALSPIAGELEPGVTGTGSSSSSGDPGDDEPDVVAAEPAPSSPEPVAVGPGGAVGVDDSPANATGSVGDVADDSDVANDSDDSDVSDVADEPGVDTGDPDASTDGDEPSVHDSTDPDESEDDSASSVDEIGADADDEEPADAGETADVGEQEDVEEPVETDQPGAEEADPDDVTADASSAGDRRESKMATEESSGDGDPVGSGGPDTSETAVDAGGPSATVDDADRDAVDEADWGPIDQDDVDGGEPTPDEPDLSFDAEGAFEFGEDVDADEELTVDEAVETVNEDEPALSRSGQGVESSAEADDDGAVLTFEFDPSTVQAGDSTKRLLRYQLRSFADQESTPDGEVSVEGDRVVVDIPDADGAAVSAWERAVVDVIDRTMFLSDNGG